MTRQGHRAVTEWPGDGRRMLGGPADRGPRRDASSGPTGNGDTPSQASGPSNPPAARPRSQQEHLLRIVEEEPGLNIREVAKRFGRSRSAARHHLRRLIATDQVVVQRQGHHRLHFSSDVPERRQKAIALLRVGSVRTLVEEVMDDPVVRAADLADRAEVTARAIRHSLRLLERAGLATDEPVTGVRGARRVTPHPELRVAWLRWCKAAGRAGPGEPLFRAPGWVIAVEAAIANLVTAWFT